MQNVLYVLLTVDTEASMHQMKPLSPDMMIYGKIGNRSYGVPWIIQTCKQFDCRATFFVSALEALHFGDGMVKDVCDYIVSNGNDVQLHIHSAWKNGKKFLWENSLEEQIKIIGEGANILKNLTGEYPIAHRAGGLGANIDTLRALNKLGIPMDSSMYYRGPNCRLWPYVPTINFICEFAGVIEVPVTQFDQLNLFNFKFVRTVDINADLLSELKLIIRQAKKQGLKIINILMHSFSFVYRSSDRSSIKPNFIDMKRFEKLMEYLAHDPEIEIITFKELYRRYKENPNTFKRCDYLPHTGPHYIILRSIRHFNRSWKNRFTVFILIAFLALLLHFLLFIS